jgi:hypothetical protein
MSHLVHTIYIYIYKEILATYISLAHVPQTLSSLLVQDKEAHYSHCSIHSLYAHTFIVVVVIISI